MTSNRASTLALRGIEPIESSGQSTQKEMATPSLQTRIDEVSSVLRSQPRSAEDRWKMFELLCVESAWPRALKQLQLWATLLPSGHTAATAHLYRNLIQSESFRADVFGGNKTPAFVQPAPTWLTDLIRANALLEAGEAAASDTLRAQALDQAPARAGEGSETGEFTWLADSDTRIGPVCEVIVAGGYRWIPFEQISSVRILKPKSVLDSVWCPALISLTDATLLRGYVPGRYPGSESATDDFKFGRATSWTDTGVSTVIGTGQKTWTTDRGDWGLLHIGECRFTPEGAHGPA